MISQQQVLAIYDRANPAKGPEDVTARVSAAGYLAEIEQRSSNVTQAQTRSLERKAREPRPALWLVAAVAVVVFGVAAFFMTRTAPVASTDIELVESLMEAWNSRDGEAIAGHFTTDGVFDASGAEPNISEAWVGQAEIAAMTAGYSREHEWADSFDYTREGDEIVFNRTVLQDAPTDTGTIGRPQGVVVVITDGLIESLVIESDVLHYCIGSTTDRCKVRATGEVRQAG